MESNDQKNYQLIKTPDFKNWVKYLSKENKDRINEILICWEDLQEKMNNESFI